MSFKTYKVFDCQEMPDNVRKAFFDIFDHTKANDIYVEWYGSSHKECLEEGQPMYNLVHDWLVENGAGENENVLIKHWW